MAANAMIRFKLSQLGNFLELTGEPSIPFKIWLGLVNDYFYLKECVSEKPLQKKITTSFLSLVVKLYDKISVFTPDDYPMRHC